jgi:hypothetical protein
LMLENFAFLSIWWKQSCSKWNHFNVVVFWFQKKPLKKVPCATNLTFFEHSIGSWQKSKKQCTT